MNSVHNTVLVSATLVLGVLAALLVLRKSSLSRPSLVRGRQNARAAAADETTPEAAKILYGQLAKLHDRGVTRSGSEAKELALHSSIGHVYRDAGRFSEAIQEYALARDLAMQLGGTELIVSCQTTLGNNYLASGRLLDAQQELEAAHERMERDGLRIVATSWALANLRRDMGKIEDALLIYQHAWEEQQNVKKPAVRVDSGAGLLSDMGQAYHSRGQLEKAIAKYNQALEVQSGEEAGDSQVLALIYARLGMASQDKGDVKHAAEHYQTALRLQQKVLREDHPRIAETLMNMARNQRDSGEGFSAALRTLKRAEGMLVRKETSPEYAAILAMKADFLREDGHPEDAEGYARRALKIQEDIHGAQSVPDIAITENTLGSILHDQEKYKHAVKHYMRALAINLKTFGAFHPETAATYNNLGNVYQDGGDEETAERYYKKCLEIQKKVLEGPNPELAASYNNLATILLRQKKVEQAEQLLSKAVEVARAAGLPLSSPDRGIYEENLKQVRSSLSVKGRLQDKAKVTLNQGIAVPD